MARRSGVRVVVALLVATGVAAAAPAFDWVSRGIGGGGSFYSPTISPFDPQQVYLATDMSAVFRSTDFGHSWTTVPFTTLEGGVETEVRFTSSPSVLYAVNPANDLRTPVKSTDGGVTWSPLPGDPTGGEVYTLWADPASTTRLFLAGYSDLYSSNDGGGSFSLVHSAADEHVAGVFWDGSEVWVGARDGLLLSTDSGSTFNLSTVGGLPADEAMVSFAGAREGSTVRFFAVTLGSGDVWPLITGGEYWSYHAVYRLNRGDAAWVQVTTGITGGAHPFFVAMALDDVDVAYLGGSDTDTGAPLVYKTSNGGGSWGPVFLTDGNANIYTGWSGYGGDEGWGFGECAFGLTVAPHDANRVLISDMGYAHVTSDGGATWHQAYVRPEDENPAGAPTPPGRAYAGDGLEDTSVWSLHWASRDVLIASFTDIRGIRSTDRGYHWSAGSSLGLPLNTTYQVVEQESTGALYGATSSIHDLYESTYLQDGRIDGGQGTVIISTDQGASWDLLHDFGHPVIWLAFDPNDADSLYASVVHSSLGGIYVTHDLHLGAAATWARLATPPRTEGHPLTIVVLADGGLLASYSGRRDSSGAFTQSSGVFLSTDGGASWLDRTDTGMRRWTKDVVVDPYDPLQQTWYAAVFSHWGAYPNEVGGVYRTTDRGLSWTRITDLYRVESVTVDPRDPDTLYATTEGAGLWWTVNLSDPQPTFTQVVGYPFSHPVRVFFSPFDPDEIWATSFGNGLRVRQVVLFADGFETGSTAAWSLTVP